MDRSLDLAAAEVEAYVAQAGWDQRPALFALVRTAQFAAEEPAAAARLGLAGSGGDGLTPLEQDALPDDGLDTVLAGIAWPESVAGCALSQEIVILPPAAEQEVRDAAAAAAHPDRREARLVVAVLRDGSSASLLRLRGSSEQPDDLRTGSDLAPNLAAALLATLRD